MLSFSMAMSSDVGDAREANFGVEDLEQLLLLFDGELQVRGDDVGELSGLVGAERWRPWFPELSDC